jgi:hypothetical protein
MPVLPCSKPVAPPAPPATLPSAFFTAFCGQNLKVTNDALVQSKIDDYYRGRVFALYDVIVNGAIVSGAIIAALLLFIDMKDVFQLLLMMLKKSGFLVQSKHSSVINLSGLRGSSVRWTTINLRALRFIQQTVSQMLNLIKEP